MSIRLKTIPSDDTVTHVALIGRLDFQGVTEIQYEFMHQTIALPKATIVDLSEVTYIASLGISMLVSVAKKLEREGLKMVLVSPAPMVKKTLETSHLHEVIPIASESTSALAAVR